MASVNKATIVGHVGREPEIRAFQNGGRVASFSVATSERWKKDGEQKEKTEWHRVSVTNEKLVEVVERYVKKGSQIYIEGKIETRKWTDKDGVEKFSTEIVVRPFGGEIVLLGGKENKEEKQAELPIAKEDIDDSIPF